MASPSYGHLFYIPRVSAYESFHCMRKTCYIYIMILLILSYNVLELQHYMYFLPSTCNWYINSLYIGGWHWVAWELWEVLIFSFAVNSKSRYWGESVIFFNHLPLQFYVLLFRLLLTKVHVATVSDKIVEAFFSNGVSPSLVSKLGCQTVAQYCMEGMGEEDFIFFQSQTNFITDCSFLTV